MKLSLLVKDLDFVHATGLEKPGQLFVHGVSHDSRTTKTGDIFVALSGGSFDGHGYINQAIEKGAVAVVGEKPDATQKTPYIQVKNSRRALAKIGAALNGYPAKEMRVIGVTGTDGKTTTVNLIYHILSFCGINLGMVSTVNARIGKEIIDTGFHVTTPESPMVQSILKKMNESGLEHVVLEATSHGLEQERVAECYFDIAVVTNITHEHLDYHGDYDHYLQSKAKLFTGLNHDAEKPGKPTPIAVLNRADISYGPLKKVIDAEDIENLKMFTYGVHEMSDMWAENIINQPDGLNFDLVLQNGQKHAIRTNLIGEYNAFNIQAAVCAAHFGYRLPLKRIAEAVESFSGVPGRMEVIDLGQPFTAIVDFAHTPNALKVALETSRNRKNNRVIAVFGSAGLRDREKRRMMAATSMEYADITIITAEDPRTEELKDILAEMRDEAESKGGVVGRNLFIIPDRGEAIRRAVYMANKSDLVIACGKGHEQSMCFGETEYAWDDRTAMRSALAELMGVEGPDMPYLPTQEE